MCVIGAFDSQSHKPTLEELKAMETTNPDGAGIAWVQDGKVQWEKAIKADRVFEIINGIPDGTPFIVHFRIASVGGVVDRLCHPFPLVDNVPTALKGSADAVLFHNGHWNDWKDVCLKTILNKRVKFPAGLWSDSRAIAWLIKQYGKGILSLIEGMNRFAILTPKGIERWGDWKKVGDIICSNDYWEKKGTYGGYQGSSYMGNNLIDKETLPVPSTDLSKPHGKKNITMLTGGYSKKYHKDGAGETIPEDVFEGMSEDEINEIKAIQYQNDIEGWTPQKTPEDVLEEYWEESGSHIPISMLTAKQYNSDDAGSYA